MEVMSVISVNESVLLQQKFKSGVNDGDEQ